MSFSGNTVLTVSHMSFSNNHARYGGAIDEPLGTLTLTIQVLAAILPSLKAGRSIRKQKAN